MEQGRTSLGERLNDGDEPVRLSRTLYERAVESGLKTPRPRRRKPRRRKLGRRKLGRRKLGRRKLGRR